MLSQALSKPYSEQITILNTSTQTHICYNGRSVRCTHHIFAKFLQVLLDCEGRTQTRRHLFCTLYQRDPQTTQDLKRMDGYCSSIRKLLRDEFQLDCIVTVWGIGYYIGQPLRSECVRKVGWLIHHGLPDPTEPINWTRRYRQVVLDALQERLLSVDELQRIYPVLQSHIIAEWQTASAHKHTTSP